MISIKSPFEMAKEIAKKAQAKRLKLKYKSENFVRKVRGKLWHTEEV